MNTVGNNESSKDRLTMSSFLDGEQSAQYGLAYDKAAEYLRVIQMRMSREVGWKDSGRPYDFAGADCYHLIEKDNRFLFARGEEVLAEFYPKAGGKLGFRSENFFAGYGHNVNPWYPLADLMNGKYCLEESNIKQAVSESNNGRMLIYGVTLGNETAIACPSDDRKLQAALAERNQDFLIISFETMERAMERWSDQNLKPGFEAPISPKVIRFSWDGETLASEEELYQSLTANTWDAFEVLRSECERVRTELERAAGIEDNRHFRFENAVYPVYSYDSFILTLCKACGRELTGHLTLVRDKVFLFKETNPPVLDKEYGSLSEGIDDIRQTILSEKNVSLAKADYNRYCQSLSESAGKGEGKDAKKGNSTFKKVTFGKKI